MVEAKVDISSFETFTVIFPLCHSVCKDEYKHILNIRSLQLMKIILKQTQKRFT